jgi:hypothetical protein
MTKSEQHQRDQTEDQEQTMTTKAPFVIIASPHAHLELDVRLGDLRAHPALDPEQILEPTAAAFDHAGRILVAFDYPGRVSA